MKPLFANIKKAANDLQVCRAVESIYKQTEEQIGRLGVCCRRCGKCCCFEEYDLQLMVSTAEVGYLLRWLLRQDESLRHKVLGQHDESYKTCPFLEQGLCLARAGRVLGCRIFFCQTTTTQREQMENIYEWGHRNLGLLHEESGLEYHYIFWAKAILALAELLEQPSRMGRKYSQTFEVIGEAKSHSPR